MSYLALVNETELELANEADVKSALRDGMLLPESWIKHAEAEADWQTVAEVFPELVREWERAAKE